MKAHAANHQKQTSNPRCRKSGYGIVEQSNHDNLDAPPMERVMEEDEEEIPEEKMHEVPSTRNTSDEEPNERVDDILLPFGNDINVIEESLVKDRQSRSGSMRSSAKKISQCLKRMDELHISSPSMSQRTIATRVAREFSTFPRNCYRWKYEWSRHKQVEIHKSANAHCAGVVLPKALMAMSHGHVRRADIAEIIYHEFVVRKKKSKKVDFQ